MSLPKQAVRATENANPRWIRLASTIIKRTARTTAEFTSYDVVQKLKKYRIKTHDLRAIGSLFVQAKKDGLIESAGLVRRNDKHTRAATTVWRSLCRKNKTA
jgi:hypothetical protein